MGWGWLCCAITERFVASFPQILGFFYSLEQKEGPLQNSHFATVPHGVMPRSHRSFSVFGRKRLNGLQLRPEARPVQSQNGIRRVRRAADRAGVEQRDPAALLQRGMVRVAEERQTRAEIGRAHV